MQVKKLKNLKNVLTRIYKKFIILIVPQNK